MERRAGILHYARHFSLLAGMTALVAATSRWISAMGLVPSFGLYGALHASLLIITLRASQLGWRKLLFVAIGASLSMLVANLGIAGSHFIGKLPGISAPGLLAVSSGAGAASYAVVIRRFFGAALPPRALIRIALGCAVASLAVLASGIHHIGGAFCFAAAWWFAMSLGLWAHDGLRVVPRP